MPADMTVPQGTQWFAVHTLSGQENKVKTNLEQRIETMGMAGKIMKIIVPTEDEIEVRDGGYLYRAQPSVDDRTTILEFEYRRVDTLPPEYAHAAR